MSQHFLNADFKGIPVRVQMGWDKPMQWYYAVVSIVDESGELGDPIYSNLDELFPEELTPEYFQALIKERFSIDVPAEVLHEIRADRAANIVNKTVFY